MLKLADDSREKKAAEEFGVDYDPLEYLLVCLIDAYEGGAKKQRATRLQHAYSAITGKRRKRVDEPDSTVAKAINRYFVLERQNYLDQLRPEAGGEAYTEEEYLAEHSEMTAHKLVTLAVEPFGVGSQDLQEHVYKRVMGTYGNKIVREEAEVYHDALRARASYHDDAKERSLYQDFRTIAELLLKHGVSMKLDGPFWRVKDRPGTD